MNLRITRIKPAFSKDLDANRAFIESFMSNMSSRYSNTMLSILRDPKGLNYSLPLISYVLIHIHEIIGLSNTEHGNKFISHQTINKFLNMFIESKIETLPPAAYYIPKFNLYHHGNICHLNTCLLMLASMYHMLKYMNDIPDSKCPMELNILRHILTNSYSPVDMNPELLFDLIAILKIDINQILPAEETMASIVKLMSKSVPTNMLIHWDFAHSTLTDKADKDLTINQIVDKYAPTYLLANAQDFNVALEVPQNDQFVPQYDTEKHTYCLASVIIHHGVHFINVFMKGAGNYIIKDDLYHRYVTPPTKVDSISRLQVTELCYVKTK